MISIRILTPSALALAFASCASHKADQYDTVAPHSAGQVNAPYSASSNPVYDTPAAYEESSATTAGASSNPAIAPYNPEPTASTTAAAPATSPTNGAATIHTVVAGDTLSGISAKYKVSIAAIKQANNMTKDTVILGRKMVIPPAR